MKKPGNQPSGKQLETCAGIILKPGREKSIVNRHQWLFSGAIKSFPPGFTDGNLYPVYSAEG
ncbi:MAG: hypothetical protein WC524_05870, partial [Candidatus Aminicenantales bacterium]